MIITISGSPGSGKTTVAKLVAKKLKMKHYSLGDFMGGIAIDKGISLLELSKLAEKSDEIDKALDDKQISLGKKEDNFIIDSRLGWHFIPRSIKIFLNADINEAAKRIFSCSRKDEKENTSLKKTLENIKKRIASERKRFREYYGLDIYKKQNYDIWIDTTDLGIKDVVKKLIGLIISADNKDYKE